jgi:hypothetical protein
MNAVNTPQTRCRAAIARGDITPPVGIYHRMWGAASHDRATGIHRPLTATLLWLAPESGDESQALVIASLDHCLLDNEDIERMQRSIAVATGLRPEQAVIAVTHTHAAGLMSRSRSQLPGGELIGPYLDSLAEQLVQLAAETQRSARPATIVYGTGRCTLAQHRDFFDDQRQQFVCGFNPAGIADDTLLAAKIVEEGGQRLAVVVNYACHPTTLAWQNTLISPDYVGALRAVAEQRMLAPCLFLQGASADLGPREGFVGDTAIADRNGRQLGFAALSVLESLPPPRTRYVYSGPVVSGATIGTWRHEPQPESASQSAWKAIRFEIPLRYRPELPTLADTQAELARWQTAEAAARATGDELKAHDCRARAEQMTRQLWKLQALPAGDVFPLNVTLARLGEAVWLFVPGEHYQALQTSLRKELPGIPLVVSTITGGWQPGYIPPQEAYGRGIYQEQIAVVSAGSAERIAAAISESLRRI